MKKLFTLICLLGLAAGSALAQEVKKNYNMMLWKDGKVTEYLVSSLDSVTFRPITLVEQITLDKTDLTVLVNEYKFLEATVLPEDATYKEVVWESSNPEIATVGGNNIEQKVVGKKEGTCVVTCRATDGSGVFAQCNVTVSDANTYVDLGLPSGTLWAKKNVGAEHSTESGDYFAWGETEPKEEYSVETYKWCEDTSNLLTKYNQQPELGYHPYLSEVGFTDDLTELLPEDDAATANWGENWQMPSKEQFEELLNEEYTTIEGNSDRIRITSKSNGNYIILPCAGLRGNFHGDESLFEHTPCYWTRSLNTENSRCAWALEVGDVESYNIYRPFGFSVRPVRKQ